MKQAPAPWPRGASGYGPQGLGEALLGLLREPPDHPPGPSGGQGLDWSGLLRLASRHALFPQIGKVLEDLPREALPREVFIELWARREWRARRNGAMAEALGEILDALDADGIPALPYKGPALAEALYGDVARREFGDLDLLIRPRQLLAAQAVLKGRGFLPEYDLAPEAEAAFLRSSAQYHLVLRHPERDLLVELHWKTDPLFPVEEDTDAWWEARPWAALGEGKVRAFEPHALLLVLCLHGSKHHWSSLGWLVDVAELARQSPALDWDWVWTKAAALRATRRLALGLHLAHRLLDAPLPAETQHRAAQTHRVAALAAAIEATLFTAEPFTPGPFASLRRDLALFETPAQKLRFAFAALLEPSLVEWVRWPLPRPLHALYLPLRVLRLLGKHLLRLPARR